MTGALLGMGLVGALLSLAPVSTPAAIAYSDVGASFGGLGCSNNNQTSNWGSATAPTNAVGFSFTIIGGGGSAGDNNGGQGGQGGRGAVVSGYNPITAGQVVWAIDGCGGIDGAGFTGGYAAGRNRSNVSGGGGGAAGLCVGSGTGSCGGGVMVAIAGGGGGGSRGSGTGSCTDKTGGGGGDAGNAASGTSGGGTGFRAGDGGQGDGSSPGGGGQGGRESGIGGVRSGQGHNINGENGFNNDVPPTPGGGKGTGGLGSEGNDGIQAGGGGGGYGGGGGGGGGRDGNCTFGNWDSGGGGGGGGSWVKNTVSSVGVGTAGPRTSCPVNATGGGNAGAGANQGSQTWGCGGSISVTWRIGNPPTGANQSGLNATKGTALAIALNNGDADGNNRTCSIVTGPTKGGVSLSGGAPGSNCSASYTASANTIGADSFTYRVTDTDGLVSPTYTVSINVLNRNPTGTAVAAPGTAINKGAGTAFNLDNADLDNDTRTCTVTVNPTKSTISGGTTCSRTVTPNANTIGPDSFTYTVTDSVGGVSTSYVVNYTIANRVPGAANQNVTVDAGTATNISLANTDPDGIDTLTCVIGTAPTKGSVGGSGCTRPYTSNAGTANNGIGGTDSFTYTAQDQNGGVSAPATVGITIENPDLSLTKGHSGRFQPGTGTGTYTITISNTALSVVNGTTTITDTLPAGMKYRSHAVGTSGFTCTGTAGVSTTVTCTRATVIPAPFSGSLTITVDVAENAATPVNNSVVISSAYELSSTAANNTAVDATQVNIRPVAQPVTVGTDVDTPVVVNLVGSDANGDPLTYSIVSSPLNGTLSGSGALRQYTSDSGYQGIDTFTYRVTDNEGLQSAVQTVTIYVGVSQFRGTVTNEVGGAALPGITVYLVDNSVPSNPDPALVATATTNGAGAYDFASQFPALGAVPFGDYVVRFVDAANNFIPEWNVDSPTRATATNVAVNGASPTIAINAALTPGARIQGTVRSTAGANPTVNGLQVRLYKIGQPGSKAVTTAAGGQYEFELLTAGQYQLWFRDVNSGQWQSEWFDEATSQATSTTINLTVGQQLLVDEQVAPIVPVPPPTTGTVTGTVRSEAIGNAPLAGIQVRLYTGPTYEVSRATTTDGNGQYTFVDVVAGSYKLWFRVVQGGTHVSEFFQDSPSLAAATPISVGAGTFIADALLTPTPPPPPPSTAIISGTVTQLDGETPIAGIQVRLFLNGQVAGSVATTTDANGAYAFTGRAPGLYQLWFRDLNKAWISEWHLDQPNQAAADPVSASNGQTTTVNAALAAT